MGAAIIIMPLPGTEKSTVPALLSACHELAERSLVLFLRSFRKHRAREGRNGFRQLFFRRVPPSFHPPRPGLPFVNGTRALCARPFACNNLMPRERLYGHQLYLTVGLIVVGSCLKPSRGGAPIILFLLREA